MNEPSKYHGRIWFIVQVIGLKHSVLHKWNIGLNKAPIANKFNFTLSPSISRNISKSSLSPNTNNNYWNYGGRAYGYVKFKGDIELSTDINANIQQKTSAFPNPTNIIVWNAELRKKFFKKKTFELAVVAYDMLNQNIGFNRTINSNFINEERFDRISRYFLLRATWTFNKMTGN